MDTRFIAERVAQLRIKRGLSAKRMSELLNWNDAYINNIESGKSLPSLDRLLAICEFLKITPAQFFDVEETNPELLNETIKMLKPLNDRQLTLILEMAKEMSRFRR